MLIESLNTRCDLTRLYIVKLIFVMCKRNGSLNRTVEPSVALYRPKYKVKKRL